MHSNALDTLAVRRYRGLALIIGLVLAARQSLSRLLPYLSGAATTLREDDYWSFSSGFLRRGLLGELLLGVSRLADANMSWLFTVLFIGIYWIAISRTLEVLLEERQLLSLLLLALSPLILNYSVDREVAMLIPATILSVSRRPRMANLAILLVPVVALIHELTLVIYGPILLLALRRGDLRRAALASLVACLFVGLGILLVREQPSFWAERVFWPAHGLSGLDSSYLYSFYNRSMTSVIVMHLGEMAKGIGPIGVLFAVLLYAYTLHALRGIRPLMLCAAVTLPPMFVLTIDYGRYAYLILAAYVLLARFVQSSALSDPGEGADWLGPRQRVLLLVLAVFPTGYVIDERPVPAVVREYNQIVKKGGIIARMLQSRM